MEKRKRFRNIPIGRKYGIVFAVTLLFFAGLVGLVFQMVNNIGSGIASFEQKSNLSKEVLEIGSIERDKAFQIVSYYQTGDAIHSEKYDKNSKAFNQLKDSIGGNLKGKGTLTLFEQITNNNLELDRMMESYIRPAVASDSKSADVYITQADEILADSMTKVDDLSKELSKSEQAAAENVHRSKKTTINKLVVISIAYVLVGGVLLFLVSRSITGNLHKIVKNSYQIAQGNLDANMITYEGKDEIGKLAASVQSVLKHLRSMIGQMSTVSQTLHTQSDALNLSASEIRGGSEQVAVTMQGLASGAEKQANHSQGLAIQMKDFAKRAKTSSDHGALIEQASGEVLTMSKEGSELMAASTMQMGVIDQIVKDAVEKVKGLDVQSQKISKLIHVIKEIAEQTNLLALNAAIEAARAGEHGKGFAVVADEVRKLAEQVSVSVSDITEIVSTIQRESASVTKSLAMGYEEVTKGASQIQTTSDTFSGIDIFVSEMVNNIKEVSSSLTQMADSSLEMEKSIEEIAAITEETSLQTEEASASSQQTSAAMEEVTQSAGQLTELAEEQTKLLQLFRL